MRPPFKRLDVRRLLARGIEPLPEVLRCAARLKPGQKLIVVAPFLPSPLIEKLRAERFSASVEHQFDVTWITSFWRDEQELT